MIIGESIIIITIFLQELIISHVKENIVYSFSNGRIFSFMVIESRMCV